MEATPVRDPDFGPNPLRTRPILDRGAKRRFSEIIILDWIFILFYFANKLTDFNIFQFDIEYPISLSNQFYNCLPF